MQRAEHAMGVNYRDGEGVAVNNVEACKWSHRAAVQGHVEAQCDLGIMIFLRYNEVRKMQASMKQKSGYERQLLLVTSLLMELWAQLRCLGYSWLSKLGGAGTT
jgi:hypothetical protein